MSDHEQFQPSHNNSVRRRQAREQLRQQLRDARLERHLTNNTSWDDARRAYVECELSLTPYGKIADILKIEGLVDQLTQGEKAYLSTNLRILSRDLRHLNNELQGIYETHKDKSGNAATIEENALACSATERYADWLSTTEAVIKPTFLAIQSSLYLGEVRLKQSKTPEPAVVLESASDVAAETTIH